ncbi:Cell division protein FtsL [Paraliobacillus sp. PM-2]|uniref:cell division protein FtsL n=1 Tax=Paraliobacillus sp. PM-2 TaxID=1462524 RepID=UPI00061BB1F7|nr:cell division protein FtsL [Paraliobacillus sp. PM-2]CQR47797.1 Cell division protein FtsL [Paraliobacillus sp. PM-2]
MSASEARKWQQTVSDYTKTNQHATQPKQVKVHVNHRWVTPGEKFLYVVFGLLVTIAFAYVIHFSANLDAMNRDMQQLESEIASQQTKNENLTYQVKELSNPDRILRIAKENGLKIQNTEVKQTAEIVE